MNVLIPLNEVDGLTIGKVYELSGYTTNSGITQLINNDRHEAFGADLGDKNFRFIFNYDALNIDDSERYRVKIKSLIKEYEKKSKGEYDEGAYFVCEQIIDDLEQILENNQ